MSTPIKKEIKKLGQILDTSPRHVLEEDDPSDEEDDRGDDEVDEAEEVEDEDAVDESTDKQMPDYSNLQDITMNSSGYSNTSENNSNLNRSTSPSRKTYKKTSKSVTISTKETVTFTQISPPPIRGRRSIREDSQETTNLDYNNVINQEKNYNYKFWICCFLVSVCSIVIVFILKPLQLPNTRLEIKNSANISEEFEKNFLQLKYLFPSQSRQFWNILKATTKTIINNEYPLEPAVLMIAIPKGVQRTAGCLVRKYSDVVTESFHSSSAVNFDSGIYSSISPAHVKHIIDEKLKSGFDEGSRVAIIDQLESLKSESVMMFHGYCDNENAPFKRVAIVFLLNVEEKEADLDKSDGYIENRLKELWNNELGADKFYPLMSRIANSIAFPTEENVETLIKIGC